MIAQTFPEWCPFCTHTCNGTEHALHMHVLALQASRPGPRARGVPYKNHNFLPPSQLSRWRNGLAHWTSNSKVVGSSPTRDALFFFFFSTIIFFFRSTMITLRAKLSSTWSTVKVAAVPAFLRRKRTLYSGSSTGRTEDLLSNEEVAFVRVSNRSCPIHGTTTLGLTAFTTSPQNSMFRTWKRQSTLMKSLSDPFANSYEPLVDSCERVRPSFHPNNSCAEGLESYHRGQQCSSVLKKRRKKMNKHKYKKWRKKMRFKRRALK